MYNKLRTIQKMLRTKILELEKLEKKHNKILRKYELLLSENLSLKKAFDLSQQENVNLKTKIKTSAEVKETTTSSKRRQRKNATSPKRSTD